MACQAQISAETVGMTFTSCYYNTLENSPELAFLVYKECSTLSRETTCGHMVTVTGLESIRNTINSMDYKGCKFVIQRVFSQASHKQGILVLVTGWFIQRNAISRKFCQTFFLVTLSLTQYYVLNDVFRFVDEQGSKPMQSHSSKEATGVPDSLCKPAIMETEQCPDKVAEWHGVSAKANDQQVSLAESHNCPEKEQEVAQPAVQGFAYASSMVLVKKEYATAICPLPLIVNSEATNPIRPNSSSTENAGDTDASGSTRNDSRNEFSIFVGNLPYDATSAQLEGVFKSFGKIKPSGVQVRGKHGFKCYGFVHYETEESVQKALDEASSIVIGGRKANVERKSSNSCYTRGRDSVEEEPWPTTERGRGSCGGGGDYRNFQTRRSGISCPPWIRNFVRKGRSKDGESSSRGYCDSMP